MNDRLPVNFQVAQKHSVLKAKRQGEKINQGKTKVSNKLFFRHHRVHTGEKIYECPFCPDKRYAQSYSRDYHIKSHHKDADQKEACKICGVKVLTKAKMKLHLQRVHDVVEV